MKMLLKIRYYKSCIYDRTDISEGIDLTKVTTVKNV